MRRILVLLMLVVSIGAGAMPEGLNEIAHLREVADSLHRVGRTDSAYVLNETAMKLADRSGDLTQIVGTRSSQGVFLRSLGRIEEALENYGAALDIVTSGKFRDNPGPEAIEEIASLYINLATLNLDMQHKDEAAKNAALAGTWIEKSKDAGFKSLAFGAAGSVLTGCGKFEKAMQYQDMAYRNAMSDGNDDNAFRSAAYAMLVADRIGDKAKAREWRGICQAMIPEINQTMSLLVYYQAECSICMRSNSLNEALQYFDKILKLPGIENLAFVVFDCYNNMHMAYAGLGNYKDAYNTLLKGNELRDSLWAQEKAESLRDLTVKYETKETELALAQSEARRAGTLMWLFAAALLLVVIVVLFILYASRQRRRRMAREVEFANLRAGIGRKLTEQYVEGLENERERMAKELHDGVCNDLLAIRMNITNGDSIEDAGRLIDNCREAVRRISHELMPPEFAYADLDEVVRYYIFKQRDAYAGKVDIEYSSCDADWEKVPDNVALEIYRIAQEGVGNALKHSGATHVDVRMDMAGGDLTLVVEDNGNYIPSGRGGVGLNSMKRRAAAIGGNLVVKQDDKGGMSLILSVNLGKNI